MKIFLIFQLSLDFSFEVFSLLVKCQPLCLKVFWICVLNQFTMPTKLTRKPIFPSCTSFPCVYTRKFSFSFILFYFHSLCIWSLAYTMLRPKGKQEREPRTAHTVLMLINFSLFPTHSFPMTAKFPFSTATATVYVCSSDTF